FIIFPSNLEPPPPASLHPNNSSSQPILINPTPPIHRHSRFSSTVTEAPQPERLGLATLRPSPATQRPDPASAWPRLATRWPNLVVAWPDLATPWQIWPRKTLDHRMRWWCSDSVQKYAVVTGGNKGIGLEICRQLASKGISVVLTARNEKKGAEAVDKLKKSGLSDFVMFHQLDILDLESCSVLAEFIKSQIGKLDILVNNAGVSGIISEDADAFSTALVGVLGSSGGTKDNWNDVVIQTYDLAASTLETNYYGAKRTIEALLPLLQLSDSPRIVNVSSQMGKLKYIPNESVKGLLNDVENLTEERIDELLDEFLKDFKEGSIEAKGWPQYFGAYIVSKAAMNAYTRILAKIYPSFRIHCVCPGYVKTDMTYNTGILTVEEGAETPVGAALLPDDGPTGLFLVRNEVSSFEE
ncbi:hypothetical protein RD792_010645, partial [Penstemon davidsonii]